MERKRSLEQINKWKNDVIAVLLLGIFAFFINRGIEIKGLYMDDLVFVVLLWRTVFYGI